ncbi:histidine ammonia-lyase [Shewanella intestini]|uniref:Aromatic amino acid lyase n=1 Tax=Shewanella intestini TaxID=2017544 RepID=A0ABS5I2U0_9GAMM|nr:MULTISPECIES: aromatic amino acid ammonia-lyase [Shewanella]MBR9728319.1 aromatic amino acid lyase [Shewanella intestini]MRG35784.1 histidine ammonia-lyase [Shewanella sp. XMDDZSB0408]
MIQNNNPVVFGDKQISISEVCQLARQQRTAALSTQDVFVNKVQAGVDFLDDLLKNDGVIYGVTTGYGDSVTVSIPSHLVEKLPYQLTRFHGCGLGAHFDNQEARAIIVSRLASLSRGMSGVSYELLSLLTSLLEHDILPLIPEEGSVGASGDLTPLSYLAAVLIGERQVRYKGQVMDTLTAFEQAGLTPITLRPKEGLALMNGTAVMTAIACLNWQRAQYLCDLSTRITAMVSVAMQGNAFHFDEALHAVKPHQGQVLCAERLRSDLNSDLPPSNSDRLQDRYSLRCAPHVIGVLQDTLDWAKGVIEIELNSANDNPIIDGENRRVLHGGHFYGGHIAMVMDSLKTAVANVADLLDRQLAQLCDYKFNNGLPYNLSGAPADVLPINHGFKAVQIGVSSWTAEALKNTMPASVFSRSTESHNQDKVSMGTISSRDCRRVLALSEQVAIACLYAATQAIELRINAQQLSKQSLTPALLNTIDDVRAVSPFLSEDRPLETELRNGLRALANNSWTFY